MVMTTGMISIWVAMMWGDGVAVAGTQESGCPRVYVHGSECLNLGIDADLGSCGDRMVRIGKIRCGAGVATAVVVGKRKRYRIRLEQSAGTAWGDARWNLVSVEPDSGRKSFRSPARAKVSHHAGSAP
jgi:hypothetical protein